jgi:hypothetical protein
MTLARHVDWERRSVTWSESLLDVSEGRVTVAFIPFVIWHDDVKVGQPGGVFFWLLPVNQEKKEIDQ